MGVYLVHGRGSDVYLTTFTQNIPKLLFVYDFSTW